MSKPVIVCVDDEAIVLTSLKAQIRRKTGENYEVESLQTAEEALVLIKNLNSEGIEVPLVISDHIMPGMKGDEFLIELHRLYPRMIKIILTGQAGVQAVGNIVNHANLYRYISKPWDGTDLQMTVAEALRSYNQDIALEKSNEDLRLMNDNLENLVQIRTKELELEREKSERLLFNILPEDIATRLISGEHSIADIYGSASVLFADIVGFTALSATVSADELLKILNEVFLCFDRITRKYGLEKIKTIGDAYMCVAGVPKPNENHAEQAALCSLEMMESKLDIAKKIGKVLQFRIGIHSGSLVAGVIGDQKISYDIWGDTVNTASRMEFHGEIGKIHCSEGFKNCLTRHLSPSSSDGNDMGIRFLYRGEIEIKGKGKMKTYFLERRN